jgi:hypothetical protein
MIDELVVSGRPYVVSTSILSMTSFASSHLMVDICYTHDSHGWRHLFSTFINL